jgi:hypothetical protein
MAGEQFPKGGFGPISGILGEQLAAVGHLQFIIKDPATW